eukprot:scaffold162125_cov78-Attheya_sp.AAC.4
MTEKVLVPKASFDETKLDFITVPSNGQLYHLGTQNCSRGRLLITGSPRMAIYCCIAHIMAV